MKFHTARPARGFILERGIFGPQRRHQVANRSFSPRAFPFGRPCSFEWRPAGRRKRLPPRSLAGRDGDSQRQGNSALGPGEVLQGQPGDSQQQPSPEQAGIVRLNILHQMIEDEILWQRAAKLNLAASDEDVNAKLTEMKAPYTQEEWDKQLKAAQHHRGRSQARPAPLADQDQAAQQGDRVEDQHHRRRDQQLLRGAQGGVQPDRAAVSSGADCGHRRPSQQAGNLQNNKASGDADAKKKIQALHNRLESGEDFGAVAMNFSENPNTASNGGDMGFIPESQLRGDPDVYNAISKLKPGQITEIFPSTTAPAPATTPSATRSTSCWRGSRPDSAS
jgi:hypothetical protein